MSESCQSGCGHDDNPKDELEQRVREAMRKIRHKLVVLSGKGGVGKSTVATNLAVTLVQEGYRVGLVDTDVHGPSVAGLLGLMRVKPEGAEDRRIMPIQYAPNLSVISMQNLLPEIDDAVIWRGPMKIGAIRQFLGDVAWGELDYLIIDSPPGTGDEPLTIAQDVPGVRAIVVTTPQEVALADVRKSIKFCSQVVLPVAGVVENMSGYVCPECGHVENLFGTGTGAQLASSMGVRFLAQIPFDPAVVKSGDAGTPLLTGDKTSAVAVAYHSIAEQLIRQTEAEKPAKPATTPAPTADTNGTKKIAVPTNEGVLCNHFGHCEQFALLTVKDGSVVDKTMLTPPPHEPGVIPPWLAKQGADVILAGGMGQRAQEMFQASGIQVITGVPVGAPEALIEHYLGGTLMTGENVCDH